MLYISKVNRFFGLCGVDDNCSRNVKTVFHEGDTMLRRHAILTADFISSLVQNILLTRIELTTPKYLNIATPINLRSRMVSNIFTTHATGVPVDYHDQNHPHFPGDLEAQPPSQHHYHFAPCIFKKAFWVMF
jgi:hypothetical protein